MTQVRVNEKEAELDSTFEISYPLKAHRWISKNGVSKSIVHVIKHANSQLYRVLPDEVI